MRLSGEAQISDVAVLKRMRNSGEWLKWLCENIFRRAGLIVAKPQWLRDKNVKVVDGSEDVKCGIRRQCYMLHYSLDLFTLDAGELLVTDRKTGETLSNFKSFGEGDIVMGDRIYGNIPAIAYLGQMKAGYVLRINSRGFHLVNDKNQLIDLKQHLSPLKEGEIADIWARCKINEGSTNPYLRVKERRGQ
jgi:hypothetical protein